MRARFPALALLVLLLAGAACENIIGLPDYSLCGPTGAGGCGGADGTGGGDGGPDAAQ